METQNLQAFVAVAKLGSFSKAANKLHLTQPAISKRINSLESKLNRKLFDRIGRQVKLTETGQVLLQHAEQILLQMADAKRELQNINQQVSGKLSIATSHHIGLYRLAPILKIFAQKYPQVELDIHFLDSETGCKKVAKGQLELAIVTLPPTQPKDLICSKIWDDQLCITFAAEHPLANVAAIDRQELRKHLAILPAKGTFTRNIIDKNLARRKPLRVGMETNYLETIKMLVKIGIGYSVLPTTMAADNSCCQAQIGKQVIMRHLGSIVHQERSLSNAATALLSELKQQP